MEDSCKLGFSIFYILFFTPLIFMIYGPVVAGQFGLTFNMIRSLSTVSLSFITPKLPELSRLFAKRRLSQLQQEFFKIFTHVICLIRNLDDMFDHLHTYFDRVEYCGKNRFLSMYGLIMLCLIGV